jgi:DNA-binding NarL/FixJ family response regulator
VIYIPTFTRRENAVLAAMFECAETDGETGIITIARRLGLKPRTVSTHLDTMRQKAHVRDKASLVLWAVRQNGS